MEGSGDKILLLVLNLHHLALDGLLGDVFVDEDVLGLSHSVNPVKTLPFTGRIPGGIKKKKI